MGTSNTKALRRASRGLPSKFSQRPEGAASGYFRKDPLTRHGRRTAAKEDGQGRELLSQVAPEKNRESRAKVRQAAQKKKTRLGRTSIPFLDRETDRPADVRVGAQLSNTAETMKAMAEVTRELSGQDPGPTAPEPVQAQVPEPVAMLVTEPEQAPRPVPRSVKSATARLKKKTTRRARAKTARGKTTKAKTQAKSKLKAKPKTKTKTKIKTQSKKHKKGKPRAKTIRVKTKKRARRLTLK